jgi:hypothetical protein
MHTNPLLNQEIARQLTWLLPFHRTRTTAAEPVADA